MNQLLYAQLRKRRGLGFAAPGYFGGSEYWMIDDSAYSFANPPDFWGGGNYDFWGGSEYTTPGISPYSFDDFGGDWSWDGYGWYDATTGLYVDQYGQFYDSWGTGGGNYGVDDEGTPIILRIDTYEPGNNYSDLQNTLNWWDSLTGGGVVTLPDAGTIDWNSIDWDTLFQQVYDGTIQLPGGPQYDPVRNPLPPKKSNAAKKILENILKSGATGAGGAGGASGGARPASMPPNAQGQCPQGYRLNPNTKQCVLIPPQATSDIQKFLKEYGLYLLLGGIGLILLAKK
jgi:hypothetical protein